MKVGIMLFGLALLIAPSSAGLQETPRFSPGQLIVSFRDKGENVLGMNQGNVECDFEDVQAYLAENGVTGVMELYHGSGGVKNVYLVECAQDADIEGMCGELNGFSEINGAMPNYHVEPLVSPNDWYFSHDYYPPSDPDTTRDQYILLLMQADKAWNVENGDSSVTIAILDYGIDYLHADLKNNIWVNPGEDLDGDREVWDVDDMNGVDNDGDSLVDDLVGYDFYGSNDNNPFPDTLLEGSQHGTMMASVGAVTDNDVSSGDTSMAGITWHCKLVPVKCLGTTADDVIEGLNYVATKHFDVANMSFYLPWYLPNPNNDPLHEAVTNAYNAGVVLVGAINKESPGAPGYPNAYDEVILCSVVDENGVKPSYPVTTLDTLMEWLFVDLDSHLLTVNRPSYLQPLDTIIQNTIPDHRSLTCTGGTGYQPHMLLLKYLPLPGCCGPCTPIPLRSSSSMKSNAERSM